MFVLRVCFSSICLRGAPLLRSWSPASTGLLFSRSLLSLNNVKEDNNNVKEGQMKETDEQNETYLGKDEPSASADQDGARKNPETREVGGPGGPEPTRYGDWEKAGRCCDF
ncbi:hypothetical protein O6H91_23G028000 [Diphasiastrum complanatum]|uniref:Uncharacterized protein n=1 Tax=Diphasiastrum complanatum TaxID=34168 RepID=A0ACC2A989_DIPCM|nr:hypothetical protein O6H91_23G028000 [Diphasiastrum complanatum]